MVDIKEINELIKEVDSVFKEDGIFLYKYEVSLVKKVYRIKIALDKIVNEEETGVSIDDCSMIAKFIKKEMEKRYGEILFNLEVSSPGAERELTRIEEYERFAGKKVRIKQEIDGSKIVKKGNIEDVSIEDGTFVLMQPGTKKTRTVRETINIKNIKKANLSIS